MGRASTAQANYDTAAAELTRLQTSAPYPDAANLAKMEELKKEHKASIEELQKNLATRQIPLTPAVSPAQFQDKLKEAVTRVKNAAAAANVSLGKDQTTTKFYLSFDRYETESPKPEAAAPLLRMLESMELVVNMLIANNVTEISELKRDLLPEEGGKKETGKDAGKASSKDETKALVVRHPFEVSFVAHEGKFHKFINNLVAERKQFYIPKSVAVKNEKEQGPSRSIASASTPPPPPPTSPDPAAPPSAPSADPNAPAAPAPQAPTAADPILIVGEEKLNVTVKIDVVDFAGAPPPKAEAGGSPAKAEK
jgi:hypothetical protein